MVDYFKIQSNGFILFYFFLPFLKGSGGVMDKYIIKLHKIWYIVIFYNIAMREFKYQMLFYHDNPVQFPHQEGRVQHIWGPAAGT